MIKVELGEVVIEGARLDLIFEFNALLRAMVKHEPDIVAISIAEQGDVIAHEFLESKIAKDDTKLVLVEALVKSAINAMKGAQI